MLTIRELNEAGFKTIGAGYTTAVIMDELNKGKFIGYIMNKDEWVVATKFDSDSYGWSHYFTRIDDAIDYIMNHNLSNSHDYSFTNNLCDRYDTLEQLVIGAM